MDGLPVLNNLVLRLDASAITGLVDTDSVSVWQDSSGNGNTAVIVNAGDEAEYRTSVLGGRPVVRFNGSTSRLRIAGDVLLGGSDLTAFAVFRQADTAVDQRFLTATNVVAGDRPSWSLQVESGHKFRFFCYAGDSATPLALLSTTLLADNTFYIVGVRYSATLPPFNLYIDGVQESSASRTGVLTRATDYTEVGRYPSSDVYFGGDIAEILVYDTDVSDTDVENAMAFLQQKWIGTGYIPQILVM